MCVCVGKLYDAPSSHMLVAVAKECATKDGAVS